MTYWLDANIFIQSSRKIYPFERYPEFWAFLSAQITAGKIGSSEFVWRELVAGEDFLAKWAKTRKDSGLNTLASQAVQTCVTEITDFVEAEPAYQARRREEFNSSADLWLIAQAKATSEIVVTHETPRDSGKIKVNSVCSKLGIEWIDVYELQNRLNYNPSDYRE